PHKQKALPFPPVESEITDYNEKDSFNNDNDPFVDKDAVMKNADDEDKVIKDLVNKDEILKNDDDDDYNDDEIPII
ncbi:hypothetical protein FQN50_009485, partial [Emmonsiellopsis sp. PD_5]